MSKTLSAMAACLLMIASTSLAAPEPGTHPRTFVSAQDGSEQPYNLFIPASYDGTPTPLAVVLHGKGATWLSWFEATRVRAWAEQEGYIVISPQGRGDWFYLGMGEKDVFEAIADVKSLLAVDEDRVYLLGHSMGGWGTWHMAAAHPDVFAAIVPMAGWAPKELLGNLEYTPPFVIHGDQDAAVSVNDSRVAAAELARLGVSNRYLEIRGAGHESSMISDSFPLIGDWLRGRVRETAPAEIHHTAWTPTRGRAWWLSIREVLPVGGVRRTARDILQLAPASAHALWSDDENAATLSITTENAGELAIDFSRRPLSESNAATIRLRIDNQEIELEKPGAEEVLLLVRGDKGAPRLQLPAMKWSHTVMPRAELPAAEAPVLGRSVSDRETAIAAVARMLVQEEGEAALLTATHFLPDVPEENWTLDDVVDFYALTGHDLPERPVLVSGAELRRLAADTSSWLPAWWGHVVVHPPLAELEDERDYSLIAPPRVLNLFLKQLENPREAERGRVPDTLRSRIYRHLLSEGAL